MNKQVWMIGAGIVIVCLIVLVLYMSQRRAKKWEMRRKIDDKLREEALDKLLVGSRRGEAPDGSPPVPFEVRYDLDQREKNGQAILHNQNSVMVQLTERSELSTRKYMLPISDRLSFGAQASNNDITVTGAGVAGKQCEVFRIGKDLFVKNTAPDNHILLSRKQLKTSVKQDAVKLENHDVLHIGECVYEITIMK